MIPFHAHLNERDSSGTPGGNRLRFGTNILLDLRAKQLKCGRKKIIWASLIVTIFSQMPFSGMMTFWTDKEATGWRNNKEASFQFRKHFIRFDYVNRLKTVTQQHFGT